jgi:hypothetical protein
MHYNVFQAYTGAPNVSTSATNVNKFRGAFCVVTRLLAPKGTNNISRDADTAKKLREK